MTKLQISPHKSSNFVSFIRFLHINLASTALSEEAESKQKKEVPKDLFFYSYYLPKDYSETFQARAAAPKRAASASFKPESMNLAVSL